MLNSEVRVVGIIGNMRFLSFLDLNIEILIVHDFNADDMKDIADIKDIGYSHVEGSIHRFV